MSTDLHRFGCMTADCGSARISGLNLTQAQADSEARVDGWTIWRGTTRGGAESTAIICPFHEADAS